MNMNSHFIAIDFETATSSTRFACQIGIVVVKDGQITERISHLIQPPHNEYDNSTICVHHITPEATSSAPTFDVLWPQIEHYFRSPIIVAHNVSFDRDVLYKNLEYYSIFPMGLGNFVCTCDLYGRTGLADLCLAFGMSKEGHHDALFDAECCAQFYLNYLNGVKPDFSLIPSKSSKKEKALKGDILVKDLSQADPNNPFYDRKVVITGDFCLERKELAARLKQMGADINTTISKKTHFVLVGENPGPSKMEKLEKLIHDGFNIRKIYQDDLLSILNGEGESFVVSKEVVKDLDLTYNHFESHHFDLSKQSLSGKEIFVDRNITSGRLFLKQMLGNLGAYANEELFPETNICLLSDDTIESLLKGTKNDTIKFIQDTYNKEKSVTFDFNFMGLSELLETCKKRCDNCHDELTLSLYEQFMEEAMSAVQEQEERKQAEKRKKPYFRENGKYVIYLSDGRTWCPSRQMRGDKMSLDD